MGPKNQRKPEVTPSKQSKKQRLSSPAASLTTTRTRGHVDSDEEVMRSNMAASSNNSKRLQFDDVEDSGEEPPRWFSLFEQRLDHRLQQLDYVARELEQLTVKVKEQDEKIKGVEYDVKGIDERVEALKEENKSLFLKLDDIENRSRRINLVFHKVPEKQGQERENCMETVTEIINNFVGFDTPCESIVERCHRTGRRDPDKPRIIHVAFNSFSVREKVRKACIAKFKSSTFHGVKLGVGEDFSKHVIQLRQTKMARFKQLKEEGKQPFFVFPASLKYRVNGQLISVD